LGREADGHLLFVDVEAPAAVARGGRRLGRAVAAPDEDLLWALSIAKRAGGGKARLRGYPVDAGKSPGATTALRENFLTPNGRWFGFRRLQ
jgi:hypothetical protein